jgi:zinc-dependent metalloproteinase lipoprotein
MKFNFTTTAALLLMLPLFSIAQSQTSRTVFGQTVQSINPKNGLIRCLSTEYEQALQQKNPNRANREAFESWLAPKTAAIKQRLESNRSAAAVVTIPVVVHVIHNGDAVGTNENISDARVLSQITVLNQDFRRMIGTPGYNTNAVGADMEIEFVMAKRKPDGTATNGIDRVQMSRASWASESSIENQLKANTSWDPTQYFNIWVCAFSDNENDEMYGTLGYAQFPSSSGLGGIEVNGGEANTDGVIIDYRCFGSSTYAPSSNYFEDYDKGRTLTHEIGHCFGLIHIWGDNSSCSVNATDSAQDFCPDTPAAREEHYDCLRTYNTCTAAAGNDMVENYMDYTNDTCMNIFTLDQKGRVLAVLQNAPRRASLTTSTVGQTLGTASLDKLSTISLYPNPATAFVNISATASNLPDAYAVYNSVGQLVAQSNIVTVSDLTINTTAYHSGVYFIKISKDDAVKTLQFVKN